MRQCPMLSPEGNLYKPADRIGATCLRCKRGKLYEQKTIYGAMIGCTQYMGMPRCTYRGSSLKSDDFRCGISGCPVHHASKGCRPVLHVPHPASSSAAPVFSKEGCCSNAVVNYEVLWDEELIPANLFSLHEPPRSSVSRNSAKGSRRSAVFHAAKASTQVHSRPGSVANIWGQSFVPKPLSQKQTKSGKRKRMGRPPVVLSDGCVRIQKSSSLRYNWGCFFRQAAVAIIFY